MADDVLDYLRAQFARVHERLDGIDHRLDALTTRVSGIEKQMAAMVHVQAATNARLDHLETRFTRIERRLGLIDVEAAP